MNGHLLIVEDERMVLGLLGLHLRNEGYVVSLACSGKEMFGILEKEAVDLILLDLNLPDEDGLVLARRVRRRSTVPIIVLTARKNMDDRISALEIGVDDYMVKPYEPRELLLKVHNMINRSKGGLSANLLVADVVRFGDWTLDIPGRSLTGKTRGEVNLTPGEFNILAALAQAQNRALSRDQLLDAISRDNDAPSDRAVDIVVSRLRKKIEKDPKASRLILTITGYGYKLASKVS